jgi:hypothetical protein
VQSRRSSWVGGGLAVLLAIAQFRLIAMMLQADYGRSIQAAAGVVEGRPHWRVYQNRILGPYAIEGLSSVFPSYIAAHVFLSIVVLAAAGFIAWRIGERVGGRRSALLALVTLHLGSALLLAKQVGVLPWLYIWDHIDILVFVLFVEFVVADRPWPWFAALAGVGVFNHESAVFVAGWLIVDPVARWYLGKTGRIPPAGIDRRRVLIGALLVATSMLVVESLRTALLVEEIGAQLFGDLPNTIGGSFHVTLGDNVRTLNAIFTQSDYAMPTLVPIYLLGVVALIIAIARRDPDRFLGLAATYLVLIASLLTFGRLLETRIYVVLIPVAVLGAVLLADPPRPASSIAPLSDT